MHDQPLKLIIDSSRTDGLSEHDIHLLKVNSLINCASDLQHTEIRGPTSSVTN